jgi:ABC-type Mn2+/Zn2+ transport system permease subunit
MSKRPKGQSANKVLVIGVVCGVLAVLLVRAGVALLVGGVKTLVLIGIVGAVWLAWSGRPRRRRDG